MIKVIFEYLLQLIIVLPIILFTLKKKNFETFKILSAFAIFFLLNNILLYLPILYPEVRISNWNANWNWTGKIYAILGSILFLVFYRKFKLKDYFLTFKQDKGFIKKGILIILGILIIRIIVAYFFHSRTEWSPETLLFQFSMPGIDEEIAFRGIMLGLLTKVLKRNILILNTSVLVTAILFGFAHGFSLSNEFNIIFNIQPFLRTMIYGLIWGEITIKSGSILLALISHNSGNGIGNLIRMR